MSVTYVTVTLVHIGCCECSASFGMNQEHYDLRKKDHKGFFCPACGKMQHFVGKTKEQEEIERLKREVAYQTSAKDAYRRQKESAERRHSAAKGQITKIKKRVGNGVCPCCNRHFENLQRHMTCKHPEYKETKWATR